MRRLIPRLLNRLGSRSIVPEKIRPIRPPAKGAKSLRKQLPPHPLFFGRSRSILLDDVNPIMHPKAYRHHKGLPPQVTLPDSQKTRTVSRDGTVENDFRREMTAEEREWWANPYRMFPPLRSSSGTERHCRSPNAIYAVKEMYSVVAISPKWYVFFCHPKPYLYDADQMEHTTDFLIRLSIKQLPSSRRQTGSKRLVYTLVPDGLQHPKFKGLDSRRGHYIVCRRDAIQEFNKRGTASILLTLITKGH